MINRFYLAVFSFIITVLMLASGCSAIGKSESTASPQASTPFAQILSSGQPTLAEFGSVSCIPCKQMKPILEELAEVYQGKLNVVIIDVYDQQGLAQKYKVMAIPTQIIFDSNGNEISRHVGVWPSLEIIGQLKKIGIQ